MSQISPAIFNNKFPWIESVCGPISRDWGRIELVNRGEYNNLTNLLLYHRKEHESNFPAVSPQNKKSCATSYFSLLLDAESENRIKEIGKQIRDSKDWFRDFYSWRAYRPHFDKFWAYRRTERITAHITIFMVCQVFCVDSTQNTDERHKSRSQVCVIKLHKINTK